MSASRAVAIGHATVASAIGERIKIQWTLFRFRPAIVRRYAWDCAGNRRKQRSSQPTGLAVLRVLRTRVTHETRRALDPRHRISPAPGPDMPSLLALEIATGMVSGPGTKRARFGLAAGRSLGRQCRGPERDGRESDDGSQETRAGAPLARSNLRRGCGQKQRGRRAGRAAPGWQRRWLGLASQCNMKRCGVAPSKRSSLLLPHCALAEIKAARSLQRTESIRAELSRPTTAATHARTTPHLAPSFAAIFFPRRDKAKDWGQEKAQFASA